MHQALTNGLKGLARLAYLDISGMGCISDQLLEFLPRLTGLTALNLSDSPHVSGAMTEPLSLAALRPLTGVTMLGLSNTYVADDALTALSGISRRGIGDPDKPRMPRGLPLRANMSADVLCARRHLAGLRCLDLSFCQDMDSHALTHLHPFSALTGLSLPHSPRLRNSDYLTALHALPRLEQLDPAFCRGLGLNLRRCNGLGRREQAQQLARKILGGGWKCLPGNSFHTATTAPTVNRGMA
eukprot:jgi/Tetstr1/456772/TSEL_004139.t1